jgi:two-component system nitrate/nitrite response regulator NarL
MQLTPERHSLPVVSGGLTRGFCTKLREACEATGRYDLVCEAAIPEDFLDGIETLGRSRQTLVALSGKWLRDEGLELLIEVRRLNRNALVLLIGADLESLALGQALKLGLRGLADPSTDTFRLGKAMDVVAAGELWISRQLLFKVIGMLLPHDLESQTDVWLNLPSLTEREHDVLRKVLEGKPNKSIANELGISEQTVKIHLQHVYRKLGVHRRVDLLRAFSESRPAA